VQLCDLSVNHETPRVTLVQNLQVLQEVDGSSPEYILRSSVKRLSKDKVRVLAYSDNQWVGSQNGLDKVDRLSDSVVGGDERDVVVATVMNKTGRSMIGSHVAARSGWVRVGMEECVTDVALEQWSAICGTDVQRVIRECHGL
jgi:hypothetical protein